jgi:Spy/CpxP family protein refolding chaperone
MRKHMLLGAAAVTAVMLALGTTADAQRGGRGRGGPVGGDATVADAQPRGERRPGRAAGPGRGAVGAPESRLARHLDLSTEQQEAIGAILRSTRDETAPIADRLRLVQRDLHRSVFADAPDEAAVQALSAEAATLQKQLADLRLKAQVAVAAELTETQREQMRTSPRGPGRFGRFGRAGPARPDAGPGRGARG